MPHFSDLNCCRITGGEPAVAFDMEDTIRHLTTPFSQWAALVKAQTSPSSKQLYEEGGSSHPLSSQACIDSCCGLLVAVDALHLGSEACVELVSDGVFQTLGEGTTADWEGISKRLAQRKGTHACNPAWLQEDAQESCDSIHARIKQACCSSEVAVLMLRLAVRAACLAESRMGRGTARQHWHSSSGPVHGCPCCER